MFTRFWFYVPCCPVCQHTSPRTILEIRLNFTNRSKPFLNRQCTPPPQASSPQPAGTPPHVTSTSTSTSTGTRTRVPNDPLTSFVVVFPAHHITSTNRVCPATDPILICPLAKRSTLVESRQTATIFRSNIEIWWIIFGRERARANAIHSDLDWRDLSTAQKILLLCGVTTLFSEEIISK